MLTVTLLLSALSVSLTTTANHSLGRLWLAVAYVHQIVFKVRACANVHVALSKYLGMEDYDSYEVVIGADFNSVTQILNVTDGRVIGMSNESALSMLPIRVRKRDVKIYVTVMIYIYPSVHVNTLCIQAINTFPCSNHCDAL